MSFRRSNSEGIGSSRWRTLHRNVLLQWLPQAVVDSDRPLSYVLLHGDDEFGTGWSPMWLSAASAGEFLAFLEKELVDKVGYDIVPALRRRLAETD